MSHINLTVAAVQADGRAAWAFVIRESSREQTNRFIHSASQFGVNNAVTASLHGLIEGLRALVERDMTGSKLTIWTGVPDLYLAMTSTNAPLTDVQQLLRDGCLEALQRFREYEFKEYPAGEEDPTEKLARFAWESGTLRDFPFRRTGRAQLPAFKKGDK